MHIDHLGSSAFKTAKAESGVDSGVLWLGFGRGVRLLLVVAISAVSWLFWRSGVLQRSAGWLSE